MPGYALAGTARLLLGAALYVGVDLLLRASAFPAGGSIPWYPPAGIGFMLVVVFGWRGVAALALSRFALHLLPVRVEAWSDLSLESALAALLWAAGAAVFRAKVARAARVWTLSGVASAIGLLLGTSLAVALVAALVNGPGGQTWLAVLRMWIGDATGLLVIVPLWWAALERGERPAELPPRPAAPAGEGRVERLAFAATCLLVVAAQLFVPPSSSTLAGPLLFIPALWGAARWGIPGAIAINLGSALAVTLQTCVVQPDVTSVLESRVLLACLCTSSLIVAALRNRSDEGEAQYWQLLASSQDGIWRVDATFQTVFANARMAEILGVLADSLAGRSALEFIAPEDQALWLEHKGRRPAGISSSYEVSVVRPDGSRRRVLVTGTPVFTPATRNYAGAVAIVTDVTALRREESLRLVSESGRRRAEAVLEAIFRTSHDSMVLFRAEDETIVDVNDTWCATTGYRRDEVIGRSQKTLHIWDDPRDLERLSAQLARDGEVSDFQFTFKKRLPDGGHEQGRATLSARRAQVEGGVYFLFAGRDITAEWRAEQERAHRQRLEDLGRLASNVAHDFNNLLAVTALYTEMAREQVTQGALPSVDDLDQIVASVTRGRALTQRLLGFSRKRRVEAAPHDLTELVRRADGLVRASVGSAVELVLDLDEGLPLALLDAAQFDQILLNLAVNARDAMGETGRITISTKAVEVSPDDAELLSLGIPAGRAVALHFADSGSGMDAETQARVFEPYFSTKPEGKGTGIGLAIVDAIVRSTGGRIRLRSEPGRGTTFSLFWPEAVEAPRPEAPQRPALRVAPGFSVLVAEDEGPLRAALQRVLTGAGFRVTTAADGQEALDRVAELARAGALPHAVISDVRMPRMGGLRLAEVLQRLHPDLPMIFISAHEDEGAARAHPNVKEVVTKPFDSDALISAVGRCVRSFGRTAASKPAPAAS